MDNSTGKFLAYFKGKTKTTLKEYISPSYFEWERNAC